MCMGSGDGSMTELGVLFFMLFPSLSAGITLWFFLKQVEKIK